MTASPQPVLAEEDPEAPKHPEHPEYPEDPEDPDFTKIAT